MTIKGPQEPITPVARLKRTLNKGFAPSKGVSSRFDLESEKIFLVESGILGFGIRTPG